MILINNLTTKEKIYLTEMLNASSLFKYNFEWETLSGIKPGVIEAAINYWNGKIDARKLKALNKIKNKIIPNGT